MSTAPRTPFPTVAFIGGGNMARSLIGGLVARGVPGTSIHVAEPVAALRDALANEFDVMVHADADAATDGASVWLFAVKPQVMRAVCASVAARAQATRPLAVSIAAGITTAQMERWLGGTTTGAGAVPVVRAMPNTPALLGAGVTGLHATPQVDDEGRRQADALLSSAGATVWIDDEARMDAVTAVSGSGPAYVFLLAEAMEEAARAEGLAEDAARTLVLNTVLGAARMLAESGESPGELRRRVTSPGGTTQAAVETLESGGLRALVSRAIHAAAVRGGELSRANDADG